MRDIKKEIESKLKGVDEDINLEGEIEEYREGFKAGLEYVLVEVLE